VQVSTFFVLDSNPVLGYLQNKLRFKRITFQLAFAISANELRIPDIYEQNYMNLQPEKTVRLWIK